MNGKRFLLLLLFVSCSYFSNTGLQAQGPWYNKSIFKSVFGDFDLLANEKIIINPNDILKINARGEYLVKHVAACGYCHAGESDDLLIGGREFEDSFGKVKAANITPDPLTGIGSWSISEIVRALRSSIDYQGRPLSIEVHQGYRWMSDNDAIAVAQYLKSQSPVVHKVKRRQLGGFERNRLGLFPKHNDFVGYVPELQQNIDAGYGRYLSSYVAGCKNCHTSLSSSTWFSDPVPFSGASVKAKWVGISSSVENVPDLRSIRWKEEEIISYLSSEKGDRKNCPTSFYQGMSKNDKLAIANFLKSISNVASNRNKL